MIWTDSYLNKIIEDGEQDASNAVHCLFHRFSIDVTQGTSLYTLKDNIAGIIRITWKGYTVWPLELSDMQDSSPFYKPLGAGSQSRPFNYVRNGQGYKSIEFHPVPNETIAADDTKLDDGLDEIVAITCWMISDNSTLRIPTFSRRRLIKYYALWKAFLKEGKGQNLKASDYFKQKYDFELNMFRTIVNNSQKAILRELDSDMYVNRNYKPARPTLPSAYRYL